MPRPMIATDAMATRFGSFRPQKQRHFLLHVLQLSQKSPAFVTIASRFILASRTALPLDLLAAFELFDLGLRPFQEGLGELDLLSLVGNGMK